MSPRPLGTSYLDALDEDNVGPYEHLGLALVEAFTVPDSEARLWAMLQEAGRPGP